MRTTIILFAFALLFTGCQHDSFKLKGTAEWMNDGDTVFLMRHADMDFPSDTMVVSKGSFTLSGQAETATLGIVFPKSDPDLGTIVFIEPGTIKVNLENEQGKSTVGGTTANEALQQANTIVNAYAQHIQQLMRTIDSQHVSEENGHQLWSQMKDWQDEMTQRIIDLAEQNIDNEFGYLIVTNLDTNDLSKEKRHQLIELMPEEYRQRIK